MSLDPDFLKMLICPTTRRPLRLAGAGELAAINQRIAGGQVRNRGGAVVQAPLQQGLVVEGDAWIYPVQDDIPILLSAEGIPLTTS